MQKYLGVKQDGWVGPITRAQLNKSCQKAKDEENSKENKDNNQGNKESKNTTEGSKELDISSMTEQEKLNLIEMLKQKIF
jgi:hypothetical protein